MTRDNEDGGGEFLATPKPAPSLSIPSSNSTVSVAIIDTGVRLSLPIGPFVEPQIRGKDRMTGPAYAFLVTHAASGRKLVFDLSVRKDHATGFAPAVQARINDPASEFWVRWIDPLAASSSSSTSPPPPPPLAGTKEDERGNNGLGQGEVEIPPQDVVDVLTKGGVDPADVEAVVWSHAHFDHVGDVTRFPREATKLVVGPGFKRAFGEGWPAVADAPVKGVEWEGRALVEVAFDDEGLRIGRFRARDWWGDGSFYLLDTPGHAVGHLCGLARVRGGEGGKEAFVFMGGDCAHHPAQFRPSPYLPLPRTIAPSPLLPPTTMSSPSSSSCPGALFAPIHPAASPVDKATTPFYTPSPVVAHDLDDCVWSIAGLQEFDADERVLVINAHDESLLRVLYGEGEEGAEQKRKWVWPEGRLDGWREKGVGLAARGRWAFLGDFGGAVEGTVEV